MSTAAPTVTHRPTHEYLGFSAGIDFESRILVKPNAAELLAAELARPSWTPQNLALSGVTDAYQPIERKLQITRSCLRVLAEFRNPVIVVTKNHLVTRDADYLGGIGNSSTPRRYHFRSRRLIRSWLGSWSHAPQALLTDSTPSPRFTRQVFRLGSTLLRSFPASTNTRSRTSRRRQRRLEHNSHLTRSFGFRSRLHRFLLPGLKTIFQSEKRRS